MTTYAEKRLTIRQQETRTLVILTGLALVLFVGGWVGKSAAEARAFRRVTGKVVTTWDAMWLSLRVDCR